MDICVPYVLIIATQAQHIAGYRWGVATAESGGIVLLTVVEVKKAETRERAYKLADGGGLHLRVGMKAMSMISLKPRRHF